MTPVEKQRKCDNCQWVKELKRYTIQRAGTPWADVVTLFCKLWGCYVHSHDAERCDDFIVEDQK